MSSSWEGQLRLAVSNNIITNVKSILSSEEVKLRGNFGRDEWTSGEAPWHTAVWYGRAQMIRMLFEAGVNINSHVVRPTGEKCTALHGAVLSGKLSTIKMLLDLGADPDVEGRWGNLIGTPLDFAKKKGFKDVANMLEEHANNPKLKQPEDVKLKKIASDEALQFNAEKVQEDEKELHEALDLQDQINEKAKQKRQIETEIDNRKSNLQELEKQKKTFHSTISSLKDDSAFRNENQIRHLSEEIHPTDQTSELSSNKMSTSAEVDLSCSVCFEMPQQVFSCLECDNWVCGKCRKHLAACPICRQSFKEKQPARNKAVERVLDIQQHSLQATQEKPLVNVFKTKELNEALDLQMKLNKQIQQLKKIEDQSETIMKEVGDLEEKRKKFTSEISGLKGQLCYRNESQIEQLSRRIEELRQNVPT